MTSEKRTSPSAMAKVRSCHDQAEKPANLSNSAFMALKVVRAFPLSGRGKQAQLATPRPSCVLPRWFDA